MKTSRSRNSIYLADLTHTGQGVASNVAPLGIGLIACYLQQRLKADVDIELFKYPQDLENALQKGIPSIVGFANYSWNCEIAYKFASRIKEAAPQTTIVFGGPNYGLTDEEVRGFWEKYPHIDFYILKEGEVAFLRLVERLIASNFDIGKIKSAPIPPDNCQFLWDGKIVTGNLLPRIENLDEIGSPYLHGLMDKFFDGVLIPMIHTTRGCPFNCTFCTEGNLYYSKVAQRSDLRAELAYIAERKKSVQDLVITDANFGMFKEDAEKARILADVQEKHGWPKRIFVSTGKNQKERIIEVASILKGAISIAASLQSTNEQVLKNIKRSNISGDTLRIIVEQSTKAETPTYTEIILGLPGDTVAAHTKSLRDVLSAGLGIIRMYQLILLPQTELNTPQARREYGMKTKFRINPRSFGRYPMLGMPICAVETEEICIENNTLSAEDYFECRELDLTIEILHNTGMFEELTGVCHWLGFSWFDFLYRFFEKRRLRGAKLTNLYDKFTSDCQSRLWDSRETLQAHVENHLDTYLNDPYGTNEMAISKAVAFFELQEEFHDVMFAEMEALLASQGKLNEQLKLYLGELKTYSKLRKQNFIDFGRTEAASFHFDFLKIRRHHFAMNPESCFRCQPEEFRFLHSPEQKHAINAYIVQYGKTVDGLGRILMRAPVKTLFRDIEAGRHRGSGLTVENFG